MAALQSVRGTHDLLDDAVRRHRFVEETAFAVARRYGFGEIVTPIFEFTEVFARTLGDTSDVVTKEMYSFTDRSGDSLTLRPEGTAGVARAFVSNGLAQSLPLKLFYRGPMFRHERPQKGRQRQFHQVGVEVLGVESPLADIEALALAWRVLDALGVADVVTLEINTLGDGDSRAAYRDALVAYLSDFRDRLSEDSRDRLERNPLRILDSKDEGDRAIVADAPRMADSLTPAARDFFAEVTGGLEVLGIPFTVNPRLVRGLDYYCHTAFEFTTDALGAQGTVLAGGRYDGLIAQMGGPKTAGIGWAAGIERLAMLTARTPDPARPVAVIPMGGGDLAGLKVAEDLRAAGLAAEMGFSGNLKKRLARAADRMNARFAVILGEDESSRGAALVRDLDTGTQDEVPLASLAAWLRERPPSGR